MPTSSKVNAITNNKFNANKETAPNCSHVLTHFEPRLFVDIYSRIISKIDIFESYNPIMIEKIKRLVIPTLLKDNLIEENADGFIAKYDEILFDGSTTVDKIKRMSGAIAGSLDVMTPQNIDNSKMFYLNYKKIPKLKYDEVIEDINKLLLKILELKNTRDEGDVDCEFTYFSFYNQRNNS